MQYRPKFAGVFYAIVFTLAVGFAALVSPATAWSGYYNTRDSLAEFDAFMRDHPKASTELRNNPGLVYDGKWLRSHPEVDHFLKGHPEVRDSIGYRSGSIYRSHDRYDYRYDRWPDYRFEPRDRRPYYRVDPRDHRWGWDRR